jgi:hypothetical protein
MHFVSSFFLFLNIYISAQRWLSPRTAHRDNGKNLKMKMSVFSGKFQSHLLWWTICNDIWLSRILAWLQTFPRISDTPSGSWKSDLVLVEIQNCQAQHSNYHFISAINDYHSSDIFMGNSTRLQIQVSRFLDTHSCGNELRKLCYGLYLLGASPGSSTKTLVLAIRTPSSLEDASVL